MWLAGITHNGRAANLTVIAGLAPQSRRDICQGRWSAEKLGEGDRMDGAVVREERKV
jgi:hypothetical protein